MQHNWIPLSDRSRPPVPGEKYLWFMTDGVFEYIVTGVLNPTCTTITIADYEVIGNQWETDKYPIHYFKAYQTLCRPHNWWENPAYLLPIAAQDNVVPFRRPAKMGRTL